jgi:CubicO group peptidase (beta-lactamase class C family)
MKTRHIQPRLLALLVLLSVMAAVMGTRAESPALVKPESVGLSSARLERLAQAIQQDVTAARMPGAVVAIARKGKLAYYEAFGFVDPAAKRPMPKDAIFALSSMTKPMATVGTLMLVEEGRLLLNDPVGNYLPTLKNMQVAGAKGLEPAKRQPTLQDMLRHTAGVSYGNRGDTPLHRLYELRLKNAANQSGPEFLQELGKLPLHYQPGTATASTWPPSLWKPSVARVWEPS